MSITIKTCLWLRCNIHGWCTSVHQILNFERVTNQIYHTSPWPYQFSFRNTFNLHLLRFPLFLLFSLLNFWMSFIKWLCEWFDMCVGARKMDRFNVFGAASILQSLPKCEWHPIRATPSLAYRRRIGCRQLTKRRKSLIANTFWSSLISILWFLMHAILFFWWYSRASLIGYMYVCPSHTRLSSCPVCRFFFYLRPTTHRRRQEI